MATKSTRKSTKFNKAELVNKLDQISKNVARKGIFVARQNKYNQYDVFDYANKKLYYDNIPTKDIAQSICDRLNKRKNKYAIPHRSKRIIELCDNISKHNIDCLHYLHIITTTKDEFKHTALSIRLKESQLTLKHLMNDLRGCI